MITLLNLLRHGIVLVQSNNRSSINTEKYPPFQFVHLPYDCSICGVLQRGGDLSKITVEVVESSVSSVDVSCLD